MCFEFLFNHDAKPNQQTNYSLMEEIISLSLVDVITDCETQHFDATEKALYKSLINYCKTIDKFESSLNIVKSLLFNIENTVDLSLYNNDARNVRINIVNDHYELIVNEVDDIKALKKRINKIVKRYCKNNACLFLKLCHKYIFFHIQKMSDKNKLLNDSIQVVEKYKSI